MAFLKATTYSKDFTVAGALTTI